MRTLVTGAAGFIGSNLARGLLVSGHEVVGVDCFTDYYDPSIKRRTASDLSEHPGFRLVEADLLEGDLGPLLQGRDVVFHLAGQPGVRGSWAHGFQPYTALNVVATQRVLEAAKDRGVGRVVYASSSSVYGNAATYPCHETDVPQPHSPYGVTKLAGEHLARLYARNYGLPTVSLRYFTVFGPRQRPEMAMSQIITAALSGQPFSLFAAPGTLRDFTYVGDVVAATMAAGLVPDVPPGTVVNVAGGSPATMGEVLDIVGELTGGPVRLDVQPAVAGDVLRTGGDSSLARELLGWAPQVSLREGLRRQVAWATSLEAPDVTMSPAAAMLHLVPAQRGSSGSRAGTSGAGDSSQALQVAR